MASTTFAPKSATDPASALRLAALMGEFDKVDHYLRRGVDPNAAGDTTGRTALHAAAKEGRVDVVKLLISRGADPRKVDKGFIKGATIVPALDAFGHAARLPDETRDLVRAALDSFAIIEPYRQAQQKAAALFHRSTSAEGSTVDSPEFRTSFARLTEARNAICLEEREKFQLQVVALRNRLFVAMNQSAMGTDGKLSIEEQHRIEALFTENQVVLENICAYWHFELTHVVTLLEYIKETHFDYAACGVIAPQVFIDLYFSPFTVELIRYGVEDTDIGHEFVVLKRLPGSNLQEPDTWGPDAIYINWHGEMCLVSQRPKDTLLDKLKGDETDTLCGGMIEALQTLVDPHEFTAENTNLSAEELALIMKTRAMKVGPTVTSVSNAPPDLEALKFKELRDWIQLVNNQLEKRMRKVEAAFDHDLAESRSAVAFCRA